MMKPTDNRAWGEGEVSPVKPTDRAVGGGGGSQQ